MVMTNANKQLDPFRELKQTKRDDNKYGLVGMSDGKDEERYQAQFLGGGDTIKLKKRGAPNE